MYKKSTSLILNLTLINYFVLKDLLKINNNKGKTINKTQ